MTACASPSARQALAASRSGPPAAPNIPPYIQTVTTIFMALFGVNFTVYFLLLQRKFRQALHSSELWTYVGIILTATLAISVNIYRSMPSFGQAVHHAAFTVSSIITTTGYGTLDFNLWPEFSRVILCFLMIVGACAGSTGGGFKVSRIVILCKYAKNELERLIHPRTVKVVKVDGKQVSKETVHGVLVYTLFYILIAMASMLLVSLDNFDASTTISSVLATLNNIGPGLGAVGPAASFAGLSDLSQSRPVPGHAGRTAGNLPPFGASPAQHLGQNNGTWPAAEGFPSCGRPCCDTGAPAH